MMVRAEVAAVVDADRGRARAQGGRPAAAQRARLRRHHDLRRQGARAHRAARPLRQPPRRAGHRPRGWSLDERLRSARPARPVDRRGVPRRARDVRRRARSTSARSRSSTTRRRRSTGVPVPCVAMDVSYVDGVTGGNVFLITLDGARLLAASMMGMEQPEDPDAPELSELELSAVSEAMNQMMASAAAATSRRARHRGRDRHARHQDLHRRRHDRRQLLADPARRAGRDVDLRRAREARPAGAERLRRAHVERARRDQHRGRRRSARGHERRPRARRRRSRRCPASPCASGPSSGRTRLPSAQIVGLPTGAVVELDKQADDAIDLYVNGTHFATGRLVVVDGTDWAVRIEHVLDTSENTESGMEVARWPESW